MDDSGCLNMSTCGGAAAADGTDDESDVEGSSVNSAERPASLPRIGSQAESRYCSLLVACCLLLVDIRPLCFPMFQLPEADWSGLK